MDWTGLLRIGLPLALWLGKDGCPEHAPLPPQGVQEVLDGCKIPRTGVAGPTEEPAAAGGIREPLEDDVEWHCHAGEWNLFPWPAELGSRGMYNLVSVPDTE